MAKEDEPQSITFDRWKTLHRYDPELREYDRTEDVPRAVPHVHPGTHYRPGRKVA